MIKFFKPEDGIDIKDMKSIVKISENLKEFPEEIVTGKYFHKYITIDDANKKLNDEMIKITGGLCSSCKWHMGTWDNHESNTHYSYMLPPTLIEEEEEVEECDHLISVTTSFTLASPKSNPEYKFLDQFKFCPKCGKKLKDES